MALTTISRPRTGSVTPNLIEEVPERHHPRIVRLDDCMQYLAGVLNAGRAQMQEVKSIES